MRAKLRRPTRPKLPPRQSGQVDVAAFNALLGSLKGGVVDADDYNNLLDQLQKYGLFHSLAAAAGVEVAFGNSAIALVAANAGNVNVTHGLGKAPIRVYLQLSQGGAAWAYLAAGVYGAVTFNVTCLANAAVTGNIPFDWLAIG